MSVLPSASPTPGPTAPWWERRAAWLWESIVDGKLVDHDSEEKVAYRVAVAELGRISVPEGRFVGADPYVMGPAPVAFDQLLSGAEADVFAARAAIGPDHSRVAALILKCAVSPIASWTMATRVDDDVPALEVEGYFGYPVDAGIGSFGGVDAMTVASRVLAADAGRLRDPISTAIMNDGSSANSAVCAAPEDGAEPIAVCSSGWGDGLYPTWLGRDSTGRVIVAVTDFLLAGDPYAAPLAAPEGASANVVVQPDSVGVLNPEPTARVSLLRRLFRRG